MSDEWQPEGEEVEDYFALGAVEYKVGERGVSISEAHDAYHAWLTAHDRALREQIARDIEKHYLGPDSGRCFDGRDAPDAAERAAFDEGLQVAARIARGGDK